MALDRETELALIERVRSGDTDAFEPLVRQYERAVYSRAYALLANVEDARDAAQEAFLRAFRSIKTFRGESRFSVWLYRLTTNVCLDALRRRRPILPLSIDDDDGEERSIELPDLRYEPQSELERSELRRAVREALAMLPPPLRQAITLREIEGLSYEEIGELLGLVPGTVKSRIFRARARLLNILSSKGNIYETSASEKEERVTGRENDGGEGCSS